MPQRVPYDEFYEAVGRANAIWQAVEEGLRDIFTRAVLCVVAGDFLRTDSRSIAIMGNIFYSSTNIRGRLKMMDEVLQQATGDTDIHKEWAAIQNKIIHYYKRRNTLAHGMVWGSNGEASMIMASPFNINSRRSLNYAQVCACTKSFKKLSIRTHDLAILINKRLARPPIEQQQ